MSTGQNFGKNRDLRCNLPKRTLFKCLPEIKMSCNTYIYTFKRNATCFCSSGELWWMSVYPCGFLQSLLVAQQLANAVGGVMSGAAPGMNQPILIPFNAGGHLGGQQGLVLSLPTANIQSLVAAAAAGGIMTLPLQNLQGERRCEGEVGKGGASTTTQPVDGVRNKKHWSWKSIFFMAAKLTNAFFYSTWRFSEHRH